MEIIKINQNKKTLAPMLFLMIVALIIGPWYVFFSGKFDNKIYMKIGYVFLTGYLFYSIYIPIRKFIKKESVLTFTSSEIEINEKGKPISFLWSEVINWKIEKESDGATSYLIIETKSQKTNLNISWLEKTPAEIEKLLQVYKNKPGI